MAHSRKTNGFGILASLAIAGALLYGGLRQLNKPVITNPKPNLEAKVECVEKKTEDNLNFQTKYIQMENQETKLKSRDYKTEDFSQDTDEVLLARMLYGEARGCSKNEKITVAYTVVNRVNDGKKWNGENVKEVILKPWQYSCFNKNDVNLEKLKNPDARIFEDCLKIAEDVLNGKYNEFNFGQTHYFNPRVVRPKWVEKLDRIEEIKNTKHEFYVEK